MNYDDQHRIFLQTIMQNGAVSDEDLLALSVKIFDKKINIPIVIKYINDKLAPIAMLMKSGICEITGKKYWSIVGTTLEESIIFPSEFTQPQRTFLQSIFFEIIGGGNGCISSTNCLNLTNVPDLKLNKEEADKFLKNAIKQKLLYIKDGFIYMGVRSIIELMPYFRTIYQDQFNKCFLCKEVVFYGKKCENCNQIFHNYCVTKYISNQNKSNCPQCNQTLDMNSISDEIIEECQTLNSAGEVEVMDAE